MSKGGLAAEQWSDALESIRVNVRLTCTKTELTFRTALGRELGNVFVRFDASATTVEQRSGRLHPDNYC